MRRPIALLPALFLAFAGCQAGSTPTGGTGATSSGGSGSTGTSTASLGNGSTTGTGFGTSSAGTGGSDSGCSDAAKLVYVFTSDNQIYSFDPPSKTFTQVATPDCQSAGAQANSMAIDRNLVAWINYIGGIYRFDLNTKSGCTKAMDLPSGFEQIGMGFSSDMAGGTAETLYIDGIGGGGLAKVDTTAKKVTPIGDFGNDNNLVGESCELTGTGDARLFGYFTTSPSVRVAQLNEMNGNSISDKVLTGVSPPSDWAFSFWGGSFYLYAAPGSNGTGNSSVIKYDPTAGTVDKTYVADTNLIIVGSGVSTCAPIVPPS